jgi:acyl dehydratase
MNQLTRTRSALLRDLPALAGQHLGVSATRELTQARIDAFAEVTGDHQWIHVDPVRAKTGPFGTTVAHGFLTLSLAVELLADIFVVSDTIGVVNYGLNRVRFTAPVPVDSHVYATAELSSVTACTGGYQAAFALTFQIEGGDRPVCVAELVLRFYGDTTG